MPKKPYDRSKDISEHPILKLLWDIYAPLEKQRRKTPEGTALKLASPDWEFWNGASAYFHLYAQLMKLDLCIFYLRSKGKVGKCRPGSETVATQSGWVDYHVGYFYSLHRSIYDCTMSFTQQIIGWEIPPNQGLEKKLLKKIAGLPRLEVALAKVKARCEKFGTFRNDHLHRGQYVETSPIVGDRSFDMIKVAHDIDELIKKVRSDVHDTAHRIVIERMVRCHKRQFHQDMIREIESMHQDLWAYLDVILEIVGPELREQAVKHRHTEAK